MPARRLSAAVAFLAAAWAGPAAAQARPSTLGMSCPQAASLVRSRGAIVLGTGGQTYDRFVADRRFCEPTETARSAFVSTRDVPACLVGYRCVEPSLDDFWGDD